MELYSISYNHTMRCDAIGYDTIRYDTIKVLLKRFKFYYYNYYFHYSIQHHVCMMFASCLHHVYIIFASCLHHVCIMCASCMHYVCIIFASCLHHVCIMFASCLHHVCILFASCSHHVCIMFASCVHCVCIVFASCLHHVSIMCASCGIMFASCVHHVCIMCASCLQHPCLSNSFGRRSAFQNVHRRVGHAIHNTVARGSGTWYACDTWQLHVQWHVVCMWHVAFARAVARDKLYVVILTFFLNATWHLINLNKNKYNATHRSWRHPVGRGSLYPAARLPRSWSWFTSAYGWLPCVVISQRVMPKDHCIEETFFMWNKMI